MAVRRTRGLAVGVTGGIACGKSEVGRVLKSLGARVIEADDVAHTLMQPGEPVYRRIVRRFGPGILAGNGRIDRTVLGRRVFESAADRKVLNRITHPAVLREIRARVKQARRPGRPVAAIIPLLFEVGETAGWDAILCVTAPAALAEQRLRKKGLSGREARQRMRAQMPVAEKAKRSTHVIRNAGTRAELKKKTRMVWNEILQQELE
jgi:dephospho-CoA kinase